jgi:hypothetical protein
MSPAVSVVGAVEDPASAQHEPSIGVPGVTSERLMGEAQNSRIAERSINAGARYGSGAGGGLRMLLGGSRREETTRTDQKKSKVAEFHAALEMLDVWMAWVEGTLRRILLRTWQNFRRG